MNLEVARNLTLFPPFIFSLFFFIFFFIEVVKIGLISFRKLCVDATVILFRNSCGCAGPPCMFETGCHYFPENSLQQCSHLLERSRDGEGKGVCCPLAF